MSDNALTISLSPDVIKRIVSEHIAAALGATKPAPRSADLDIYAPLIGEWVVVRSDRSGVWMGRLSRATADGVVLLDARRAFYWSGSGSCSGLASQGPSGGKICAPLPVATVPGAPVEVIGPVADGALRRWDAVPAWVIS